jgi:hypothetical protein
MSIVVQDSFNRANSTTTLGNADTGQTWVVTGGVIGIINNQAYTPADADKIAVIDSGASDVSIQLTHASSHIYSKIFWRFTDPNNTFWIESGQIRKKIAGTATTVGTFTAGGNGTVLKVTVSGNTHTVYRNGLQVATFTDSFNQTATSHGFGMYSANARIDDFSVESLGGTPTGTTGSTLFDLKQSIYSTSLINYDLKQALYQTLSQSFDSRQAVYQNNALNFDSKQVLFNQSSSQNDTKQQLFNVSTMQYDTKQTIYQIASTLYDTLQQIADGGINGSTRFDTRMVLYANNQSLFDTKQSYYQTGVNEYDLKQAIYQASQLQSDMKIALYVSLMDQFDLKQSIYQVSQLPYDTQQSIYVYDSVSFNVENRIFKQNSQPFDTRQLLFQTAQNQFPLYQNFYQTNNVDFDTLQELLSDFVVYRQVIQYLLSINTKQHHNLNVTLRKKFNLKL